jgi:hypothetical protein
MKTTLSPLSILLTLMALSACETSSHDAADEQLRSLAGVCPAGEQIVERSAAHCPTVNGWQLWSLGASKYCNYRWTGQGSPNTAALTSHPDLVGERLGSDCGVLTDQGSDLMDPTLGPVLHDLFRAQIDALDADQLATISGITPQPVTVVIVDTSPTSVLSSTGTNSVHGEAMVDIVNDVACIGACSVNVTRELALPLVGQGQRNYNKGGYLGSFGDLARAIRNAASQPGARTIINLAVGWEGELFGHRTETPAVDAVYESLEFASCRGALIIAAAGNEAGYGEYCPLLPGGWETKPAPDANRCAELGVNGGGRKAGYHPLVYSVAGIDRKDDALDNARPDSIPRMVAAGSHVNVGTDSPTLTGSSTSTAALSGAAALLWSHFPALEVPQVMAILYDSGRATSGDSYYQLGAPLPVKQLDVCLAMQAACNTHPSCTEQLDCDGPDALLDLVAELSLANDDILGTPRTQASHPATCAGGLQNLYSWSASALSCPQPSDPDSLYTSPQPTQWPCPNCTIKKSTGVVTATLDPAYAGQTATAVDVQVMASGVAYYYRLGAVPLTSAEVFDITLTSDPNALPPGYDSATISITLPSSPRPLSNPLLIVQ